MNFNYINYPSNEWSFTAQTFEYKAFKFEVRWKRIRRHGREIPILFQLSVGLHSIEQERDVFTRNIPRPWQIFHLHSVELDR